MALTDESNGNGFYMPVAPAYGGGYGGGLGGFGGDGWWIILLLLAFNGGWGGMGGFGGGWGGMMGLGYYFPWLLNGQNGINNNISDGFRDAQLHDSVTSVRDGISSLATQLCGCCGDIQNSLCSGFAGVTASVTGAQNAISQQLNSNELASLNRSFAEQTANMQGFNGINSGVADLRYTVATEACATRNNSTQNTQSILTAITGGIQSIKDQLCQDKIDAKNDEIAQLRQEILYARGQASQAAQTATFQQGLNNEVNALYNRLKNCPVGTVPVFGNQPIFTCPTNVNGGCGCNSGLGFTA